MNETDRTVSEMFKAKAVIDDVANRLVAAVLAGATDRGLRADGHVVDLGAAIAASSCARSLRGGQDSALAARGSTRWTTFFLARVKNA